MKFREKIANFLIGNARTKENTDIKNEAPAAETTNTFGTNPSIEMIERIFGKNIAGGAPLNSATYYACMLIRCNAFAKLPIHVMRSTEKGGAEKARDHPLYELLHLRPNPYMTAHDFKWATEFQRLHHGNAYWVYTFQNGRIKHLYLLDSQRVQIYVDNAGILSKQNNAVFYAYNDPKAGLVFYKENQICHFKNFARDGISGTSVSHFIGNTINAEIMAGQVVTDRYKNGLQDPLIVTYTGELGDEMKKSIQRKFAEMGGVENAGKVVPIPPEFGVKQLETKLVNSQFFELQGLTTRHIANAFGVKSFQLNDMEKSTYSNVETQNKAFYSDTMQNVVVDYEQVMDYILLSSLDRSRGLFSQINVDALLRTTLLERYQAHQIGISTGFETPAEARALENLPFVEGTDRLFFGNGAVIPISEAGNQYK